MEYFALGILLHCMQIVHIHSHVLSCRLLSKWVFKPPWFGTRSGLVPSRSTSCSWTDSVGSSLGALATLLSESTLGPHWS
uniref:Putative secreted protein n=1 Tax=Ixodes ricinus TaxID=34613 RepID=A0A6B0U1J6_IXORI